MVEERLMVSIQCLVYNHESYLRQCLEGFVMQKTNFRFEAIVHDDASTDNSALIILEYAEKYPDIIKPIIETENQYSKHDGSLRRIMNENTYGKYVALCEGDDYWTDPFKLQKQVDFLEANPDYGLVHTNYIIKRGMSSYINNGKYINGQPYDEYLLGKFHIATLTTCYRSSFANKIDTSYLKENFKMGDYPLWFEIMRFGKIKYLPDVTATYNFLDESASHSKDKVKSILFLLNIWEVREYFAKKYNFQKTFNEIRKNLNFYKFILLLIQKKKISYSCLLKSNMFSPRKVREFLNIFFRA